MFPESNLAQKHPNLPMSLGWMAERLAFKIGRKERLEEEWGEISTVGLREGWERGVIWFYEYPIQKYSDPLNLNTFIWIGIIFSGNSRFFWSQEFEILAYDIQLDLGLIHYLIWICFDLDYFIVPLATREITVLLQSEPPWYHPVPTQLYCRLMPLFQ